MEYLAEILSSSKYFRILRITYSTLEISICTTCLHLYFLGSAGSAVACGGGTGLEKVGSRGRNTKYPWPHTERFCCCIQLPPEAHVNWFLTPSSLFFVRFLLLGLLGNQLVFALDCVLVLHSQEVSGISFYHRDGEAEEWFLFEKYAHLFTYKREEYDTLHTFTRRIHTPLYCIMYFTYQL